MWIAGMLYNFNLLLLDGLLKRCYALLTKAVVVNAFGHAKEKPGVTAPGFLIRLAASL